MNDPIWDKIIFTRIPKNLFIKYNRIFIFDLYCIALLKKTCF